MSARSGTPATAARPGSFDPASILAGDFHVHSAFSDDATSTLADNIAAAAGAGLRELRLVDHVRRTTTWVPDFLDAVAAERIPDSLTVFTGVEAKLLDVTGAVDVPDDLRVGAGGVDAVVIGDHQFPGTDGPWSPAEVRVRLDAGLATVDALDLYIEASVRAMDALESAQLGHWFSILPKVGLSEDQLSDDQLERWASAASRNGTIVEVNEKWGCPGVRAIAAARAAGAPIVSSTDSHQSDSVGRYTKVTVILEAVARNNRAGTLTSGFSRPNVRR
jgi:putative hydrolase